MTQPIHALRPGRASRRAVAGIVLALVVAGSVVRADSAATTVETTLGSAYPLDFSVSLHKALVHWLDSLTARTGAGGTGGKTAQAHQSQFDQVLGSPTSKDLSMLQRYQAVRQADIRRAGWADRERLTLAFFEAASLDDALQRAGEMVGPAHGNALAEAVRYFATRYAPIWNDGQVVHAFRAQILESERREELAAFLAGVARLFDVPPDAEPRPQIVLAPVPHGHGTHAQAIGSFLLLEVRSGEGLAEQVGPIVHENAHFLFRRIPESRRDELQRAALAAGEEAAWNLLQEALPTAIGQGIAGRSFRGEAWSLDEPWYHDPSVDAYAKRIFPLIDEALGNGGRLDAALVQKMVAAH